LSIEYNTQHILIFNITETQRAQLGRLYRIHGFSYINAVCTEFPEHAWQVWKFGKTTRGLWRQVAQQFPADPIVVSFLLDHVIDKTTLPSEKERLMKELAIGVPSVEEIILAALPSNHKIFAYGAKHITPRVTEQIVDPNTPPSYWNSNENCRRFLLDFKRVVGFKSFDDFYSLKASEIRRLGGALKALLLLIVTTNLSKC